MPEHEAPRMSDHDLLMRVCDNQERIERKVDSVCRILKGNGAPREGLVWRVAALEDDRVQRAKGAAKRERLLWTVVGAFITCAVGWAFAALVPPADASDETSPAETVIEPAAESR